MKPQSLKFKGLFLLLGVLVFTAPLFAQNSGTITGTVVDAAGAVIAGAKVQAVDQSKSVVVRQTTTGAEGFFRLEPLQPGTYSVHVEAGGMKGLDRRDVFLDSNQVLGLGQIAMQVGATLRR